MKLILCRNLSFSDHCIYLVRVYIVRGNTWEFCKWSGGGCGGGGGSKMLRGDLGLIWQCFIKNQFSEEGGAKYSPVSSPVWQGVTLLPSFIYNERKGTAPHFPWEIAHLQPQTLHHPWFAPFSLAILILWYSPGIILFWHHINCSYETLIVSLYGGEKKKTHTCRVLHWNLIAIFTLKNCASSIQTRI